MYLEVKKKNSRTPNIRNRAWKDYCIEFITFGDVSVVFRDY